MRLCHGLQRPDHPPRALLRIAPLERLATALDRDPAAIADYQKMTSELRQAGIRAEMYLGASGMNAQMKYADRRGAAAAVIVGSNERAEGRVTIKDLKAGAQQSKAIGSREEYVAERPGQWTASRAGLVAELSKIPAVQKMRAGG